MGKGNVQKKMEKKQPEGQEAQNGDVLQNTPSLLSIN